MRQPPRMATTLLRRLGPADESLVGDLHEEFAAGRSGIWFWRQTIAALACGAIRDVRRFPARAAGAIVTGWAVAAVVFLMGDMIADGLAWMLANWDRQATAYRGREWWPFWLCTTFVTYSGFALSAWVVARIHRRHAAMLLVYVAWNFAALFVTGLATEIVIRRHLIVPSLPHPLYYAISVTLPFYWHSGILLVPITMLLCGMMARRRLVL